MPARGGRHGRRRRSADRNVPDQRGPAPPRLYQRLMVEGRENPHPVPHGRSCGRAAPGRGALPGRLSGSSAMNFSRGTQTAVRSWRRSVRLRRRCTPAVCALDRLRPDWSGARSHARGDDPYPGHAAAAVPLTDSTTAPGLHLRRAGRRPEDVFAFGLAGGGAAADRGSTPLVQIHSVHRRGAGAERGALLDATNDRYLATKAGRGAHTLDLRAMTCFDAERRGTDSSRRLLQPCASRPHHQILVVHGDRQVAGGCLGQASRLAYDGAWAQDLGRCSHAAASQPVNHAATKSGMTGAEPPRARADQDFEAQPGRAPSSAAPTASGPSSFPALVGGCALRGVERVCDVFVERLRPASSTRPVTLGDDQDGAHPGTGSVTSSSSSAVIMSSSAEAVMRAAPASSTTCIRVMSRRRVSVA